jgi:hypothetical protein
MEMTCNPSIVHGRTKKGFLMEDMVGGNITEKGISDDLLDGRQVL